MARLEWITCWAAYRLALVLPLRSRLKHQLLPLAGLYAFTDGGFQEYAEGRTRSFSMVPLS